MADEQCLIPSEAAELPSHQIIVIPQKEERQISCSCFACVSGTFILIKTGIHLVLSYLWLRLLQEFEGDKTHVTLMVTMALDILYLVMLLGICILNMCNNDYLQKVKYLHKLAGLSFSLLKTAVIAYQHHNNMDNSIFDESVTFQMSVYSYVLIAINCNLVLYYIFMLCKGCRKNQRKRN